MELELDNSWIENYTKNIETQSFFLIEPLKYITIFFIYINKNKIIFYHKDKVTIQDKVIKNLKILNLIEKHKNIQLKQFKLKEILRFKLNINNREIEKFIKNNNKNKLEKINIYKDIYFEDTINIFKNLPCLYFIYELNENISNNRTSKIMPKKHNITKKYNKIT